ncbi:uncharacterized protein METZ01_LOCUS143409 [marine metagenome]|uniref:Uncharacterized protein n=1 Tax=marine metagenome TaxID=408172 RepID=A0A381ZMS4_9ZZZZ
MPEIGPATWEIMGLLQSGQPLKQQCQGSPDPKFSEQSAYNLRATAQ